MARNMLPGFTTAVAAAYRRILESEQGKFLLTCQAVIDATYARDPTNTSDVKLLRAGLLLGRITASGLWAPSVIGVSAEALDGGETAFSIGVANAVELVRRVGTSGTFKLTGPPTAGGTVRTMTVTYSAVDTSTGVVTITALGAADVQTLTFVAGADGGVFSLSYKGNTVSNLAFNIATADLQTALRALHADLANVVVTTVGGVGVDYVITNPQVGGMYTLGTIEMDLGTVADGGVVEGASLIHTTQGTGGDFVTGSLIQPTDGSETIRGILCDGYGLYMVDDAGADCDAEIAELLAGGHIYSTNIINYPADAALKAWVKAQLRVYGNYWFSDDFSG